MLAPPVGSDSSQLSLTSLTMSSIHFLSAGVSPAERSSLRSRNSNVPVSSYSSTSVSNGTDSRRYGQLTFTRRSTSFCWATIEFVLPHNQLCVSFSMSSCWRGRYGWKNASYKNQGPLIPTSLRWSQRLKHTLPNNSRGRPMNRIMLFGSEVFSSVGWLRECERDASGGDPQSSKFCNSPGTNVTREY